MKLIVGLGNYGEQYKKTRHNAGFMAVDEIIKTHNFTVVGKKFHAIVWKGCISGVDALAIAPQTYVNKSGIAVLEATNFYKISVADILVIHDDLDLDTARLKVKLAGGNGGHNGLKDIDRLMGRDYMRLRIGIDRPNHSGEVSSYVLSDFSKAELEKINFANGFIANNLSQIINGQSERFMNDYALMLQ
jgi:peptidyl-tRNA hydrolase, PTH1 family